MDWSLLTVSYVAMCNRLNIEITDIFMQNSLAFEGRVLYD